VQYDVLGPLRVTSHDVELELGGPRQRLTLALLISADGRAVSTSRLIDGVWGEDPTTTARKALQGYVHHLRAQIGDALKTERGGYSLDTGGNVDALQFSAMHREATEMRNVDPMGASDLLRAALALWRGPAYADLKDEMALIPEVVRLEDLRITALGDRIDADVASGRHVTLIGELEALTYEYPLHERFRAQHMTALYRAGRHVEAIRSYERFRKYVAEQTGLEPSVELAQLETRMLAGDESLLVPQADTAGGPSAVRGYELRKLIADNNGIQTYRAYQRSVGRQVAVRILGPELADDPEFIATFLADTARVAEVDHPHVAFVFDTWREPGRGYQARRWFAGGSLDDAVRSGGVALSAALRMLDQVGGALGQAHRQGVIHGRVGASNVLFDESGHAYLSDFAVGVKPPAGGIAKDLREFGALAHLAIAGRRPRNEAGVLQADLTGAEAPRALSTVIEAALTPESRYSRVEDLLRALRRGAGVDVVHGALAYAPRTEVRNPYKGLRAFQEADADDFYGREGLIDRLEQRLAQTRLVAVVGPSGSGKSSLVKAGLTHRLRSKSATGLLVAEMYPGAFPFEELESALLGVGVNRAALIGDLVADDRGLLRVLKQILPSDEVELVLVIDQFEELFSIVPDEPTRRLFLDSLVNALNDPHSRLQVVLTIRADFFDRPLEHARFGELVERGLVAVKALSEEELALAVAQPALSVGVEYEPGLIPQIVRDVTRQPGGLPLLQYALTELFEQRTSEVLTLDAYHRSGGVLGALGRRAEDLYAGLSGAERHAIRHALLRMVNVDEGADDLRRRVRRADLRAPDVDNRALEEALTVYVAHRLLTFDRDPVTRGPTVEVAHEALLREWSRLAEWVDAAREDLIVRRRLDVALSEWRRGEEDPSYLPVGSRLAQFREWSTTTTLALTTDERAFVEAATDGERRLEERSARRRRRAVIGLAGATAVLALLTIFAFIQRSNAKATAFAAETARLAAIAPGVSETDAELGLLLAAAAHNREVSPETLGALQRAMAGGGSQPIVTEFGSGALEVKWGGDRIVALNSQAIEVYDATTLESLATFELAVRIPPVEFDPGTFLRATGVDLDQSMDGRRAAFDISHDGHWTAIGLTSGGVELIDLVDLTSATIPDPNLAGALAFGNASDVLAVGYEDGRVITWSLLDMAVQLEMNVTDANTSLADFDGLGEAAGLFPRYDAFRFGLRALAFNEDDTLLATSQGPRARAWSTSNGAQVGSEAILTSWDTGYPYVAQDLLFQGDVLVAHSWTTLTHIDISTGRVVAMTRTPDPIPGVAPPPALAFLGDGTAAAFVGDHFVVFDMFDGAVGDPALASSETASPRMMLSWELPDRRPTEGLAISPDGDRWLVAQSDMLFIGSVDQSSLLSRTIQLDPGLSSSGISSDGRLLTVWNVVESSQGPMYDLGGPELIKIEAPTGPAESRFQELGFAAWSWTDFDRGGGNRLVQMNEFVLQVYRNHDFNQHLIEIRNITDAFLASPDGTLMAYGKCTVTSDFDGGAPGPCEWIGFDVISLESGDVLFTQAEHFTNSFSWSSDGSRLYRITGDNEVLVWDTSTWAEVDFIGGDPTGTQLVAHSPSGTYMAVVRVDGTIELLDPNTGAELGHIANIDDVGFGRVEFSSDDRLMMTTFDNASRLYDLASGRQLGSVFGNQTDAPRTQSGDVIQLVTQAGDEVEIWNLDTSTWYAIACRAVGRNMTRIEWEQFGPRDTEYRATCPQYGVESQPRRRT